MIKGLRDWKKTQWRKAAKDARQSMSLNVIEQDFLHKSLLKLVVWPDMIVSAYWPIGNELDTRPLLQFMAAHNVVTALPRVNVDGDGLVFHRWSWGETLEPSRFSLSEPPADMETICMPDIVLLPLLAYDERGHRLGYGAGHYDKTLEHGKKILKVGLCYAEQVTNIPLPSQVHDVRLDAVLTQDGLLRFK